MKRNYEKRKMDNGKRSVDNGNVFRISFMARKCALFSRGCSLIFSDIFLNTKGAAV
jgi:hypothetical protein